MNKTKTKKICKILNEFYKELTPQQQKDWNKSMREHLISWNKTVLESKIIGEK